MKILSPYETFCGSEKPESVTSYESELTVVFKSSGKTKYPGFKAHCERKSKYNGLGYGCGEKVGE